jgi:type II secretory pathway pseudopilin PulG
MSHTTRPTIAFARRCLTLLEVLIALVLLAAVAALVVPALVNRLDEHAFEAAGDTASEQLMMARAHAQATGEAVEVTYSPATGCVQARLYAPWSKEMEMGDVPPGTSPLASGAQPDRSDHDEASSSLMPPGHQRIAEAWASRSLGHGIRIAKRRPVTDEPAGDARDSGNPAPESTTDDDDSQTLEDLVDGQEVRLAVFMPDGSALVGDDLWLNDGGGRCGMISINPWSGLPIFQRLADLTDAMLAANADDEAARIDPLASEAIGSADPFLPPFSAREDDDAADGSLRQDG